jgi:hypothetical protein
MKGDLEAEYVVFVDREHYDNLSNGGKDQIINDNRASGFTLHGVHDVELNGNTALPEETPMWKST